MIRKNIIIKYYEIITKYLFIRKDYRYFCFDLNML